MATAKKTPRKRTTTKTTKTAARAKKAIRNAASGNRKYDTAEFEALFDKTHSINAVVKETGAARTTVTRHLREAGVDTTQFMDQWTSAAV